MCLRPLLSGRERAVAGGVLGACLVASVGHPVGVCDLGESVVHQAALALGQAGVVQRTDDLDRTDLPAGLVNDLDMAVPTEHRSAGLLGGGLLGGLGLGLGGGLSLGLVG